RLAGLSVAAPVAAGAHARPAAERALAWLLASPDHAPDALLPCERGSLDRRRLISPVHDLWRGVLWLLASDRRQSLARCAGAHGLQHVLDHIHHHHRCGYIPRCAGILGGRERRPHLDRSGAGGRLAALSLKATSATSAGEGRAGQRTAELIIWLLMQKE